MPLQVQSLAEWEAAGIPNMLSVIIPARNEEGHIAETVDALVKTLNEADISHEIVIINDNSSDHTEEVAKQLQVDLPSVRFLNNPPPNGFGFAVRLGLKEFRGEAVAIVMADGSDAPPDLVAFYRKLQEGYDCVFGSRFHRESKVIDYPLPKLILNRLGNLFIRILFLLRYNDVTNAFKLYRRRVIAGLQPLLSHYFNLTVELPLKSIIRGYKYAVIPNSWQNRKQGISKFKVQEIGSRYLFIILYCYIEKLFSRNDYVGQAELRQRQLQVWDR